jgi:putative transposase
MAARTAWRICSELGWWSEFGKKREKNGRKPGPVVHNDFCAVVDKHGATRHEFRAEAPNDLWLIDITSTGPAKVSSNVCAIEEPLHQPIVGYSIDSRMKSRLAFAALNHAVARRGDGAGCVLHTDRGP